MLESNLVKSINDGLKKICGKALHHESNTAGSATMNGKPDQYYDGPKADLWAEYKQLESMPRDGIVGRVNAKKRGCYSPLQFAWMSRRYNNCISAGVRTNSIGIVGLPDRRVVLQTTPTEWEEGTSIATAISRKELIDWIAAFCFQ
jgi:hypothetical protein